MLTGRGTREFPFPRFLSLLLSCAPTKKERSPPRLAHSNQPHTNGRVPFFILDQYEPLSPPPFPAVLFNRTRARHVEMNQPNRKVRPTARQSPSVHFHQLAPGPSRGRRNSPLAVRQGASQLRQTAHGASQAANARAEHAPSRPFPHPPPFRPFYVRA